MEWTFSRKYLLLVLTNDINYDILYITIKGGDVNWFSYRVLLLANGIPRLNVLPKKGLKLALII